jgi:hypothetical protein
LRNRRRAAGFAEKENFYLKLAAFIGDSQHVSDADFARGLRRLGVALDSSETAGSRGEGSRLEKSRRPQPLVDPYREHDLKS